MSTRNPPLTLCSPCYRPASLSAELAPAAPIPQLVHALHGQNNSVLSISADADNIYSGSQCQSISVWDKNTFKLKGTLRGHTGSILALENAEDRNWLFSSSGDSTVRVWCTRTLTPIYVLHPWTDTGAGDLFSIVWSAQKQTIYIGCQNTSIQWFTFPSAIPSFLDTTASTGTSTPRKAHRFFDSYPQYERKVADLNANNPNSNPPGETLDSDGCLHETTAPSPRAYLNVPATNVIDSAHYGYVYCMALSPSTREGSDDGSLHESADVHLISGSGDETVKLWNLGSDSGSPTLLHSFSCESGAVLSLVARGDTIYAGCQDGYVKVWDIETKTLVRSVIVQENVDILSLSLMHSDLYTSSANGFVQRWSAAFDCTASWPAHEGGITLSSIVTRTESDGYALITGGNDDFLKVWEIEAPKARSGAPNFQCDVDSGNSFTDKLTYALAKFVSIPSISCSPPHQEDCRQAAIWLKKCLAQLGARSSLLPTIEGKNPVVLATFEGTQTSTPNRRLLFYGHYDVISAPSDEWLSDPFTLTGRNGYLYGRGVTDNKGPILALAFAAAELIGKRALGVDLVFLIEGEEEAGSGGFSEAVGRHKEDIGRVDSILVSNSTWITDGPPCITYGLRGVIHCKVEISSDRPDLHSGVEGGDAAEPMHDMVSLLASLTGRDRKVTIPLFYDSVRPETEEEKQLYRRLAAVTQRPSSSLSSRWREPSLTVHTIEISGPKNATVIPGKVKSQVSIRIVPDQDLATIASSLIQRMKVTFAELESPNRLDITIEHTADWWLGSLDDSWFKALEAAVQEEWGVEPLRIREGGSIPSVPYLEKAFGCHALHLPLGQSSDQAHLPNERISLANLHRGKSVFQRFWLRCLLIEGPL